MGWWLVSADGGGRIDWARPTAAAPLANAFPGTDHTENHYNGDRPSDILTAFLSGASEQLRRGGIEADRDVLWRLLSTGEVPDGVPDPTGLAQRTQSCLAAIRECYREVWDRDPYPEELSACFSFCYGPWLG
jgi:hypothetical protein